MSRFYASIQGNRSEATRQGTPQSGITGHIRGWDIGISVHGHDLDGSDKFHVYATSGSNRTSEHVYLGMVEASEGGKPRFIPAEEVA